MLESIASLHSRVMADLAHADELGLMGSAAHLDRARLDLEAALSRADTSWVPHTSEAIDADRIEAVATTDDRLIVDLQDGRTISVPLAWFPKLRNATAAERSKWEIAGAGFGIHWPELDEDVHVEGLLRGLKAPRPVGPSPVPEGL